MTRTVVPPVVCLLLALAVTPVDSDAQRRRGEMPDRAELEQRIRAQMGRMMQERLGLDEAQAVRLSEVVQGFDEQRRALAQREFETRRRVEALTDGAANDAEARTLLDLQSQLRFEEAELFRAEQAALLDVLTPTQVLELQDLRQDLGRRIRALQGGGRGDPPFDFRGPGPRSDLRFNGPPPRGERVPL
jgi:Spy/CpxP family protein refolding chaperone